MAEVDFLKGHGTGNDFVVVPDLDASLDLTPDLVRALADRHRGIGGDGVIRIATAGVLVGRGVLDSLPGGVDAEDWFMDYRNADGSVAEMCGNGVRVFAHALRALTLTGESTIAVGTRAGRREVEIHSADRTDADVSVAMGVPRMFGRSTATLEGTSYDGVAVDMGNPHLACVVPGLSEGDLAGLDVTRRPTWDEGVFPDGVNLELVTPLDDGTVHMRVHERGVGETLSCGTGTVAAAVAALEAAGDPAFGTVRVVIPGGAVEVTVDGVDSVEGASGSGREAVLRGPSRLVYSSRVGTEEILGQ
ncbi:MAG: diaminopimelate epimerase [Mycobacteriaceae bacterium]|uniref:diaminopimelate epimerase n=1 Tax=Corynebacterium sp. TaxID=1720 RepID=UPI003F98048D